MAAALLSLVVAASCSGDDGPAVRLDGSARVPDDEGVATSLSAEAIEIDGERTYEVSDELMAFSTNTLRAEPLVQRRGQYVQLGLRGDTVVWIAGVAAVVPTADGPRAYYAGTFEAVEDERWVFEDGTTFAVDGLEPPAEGEQVQLEIDVAARAAVASKAVG